MVYCCVGIQVNEYSTWGVLFAYGESLIAMTMHSTNDNLGLAQVIADYSAIP